MDKKVSLLRALRTHLRERVSIEFTSRIYLYSALVGVISGPGAVLFTYGLELKPRFVLVEKLAGFRQLHPDGEVRVDFSFGGRPYTMSDFGCCFYCLHWAVCAADISRNVLHQKRKGRAPMQ